MNVMSQKDVFILALNAFLFLFFFFFLNLFRNSLSFMLHLILKALIQLDNWLNMKWKNSNISFWLRCKVSKTYHNGNNLLSYPQPLSYYS